MICPMCTLPMKRVVVRGVEIDRCANDHTFFDRRELGQVDARGAAFEQALVDASVGRDPGERNRPCARCSTTMAHLEHEGQKAEVCPSCGGVLLWSAPPIDPQVLGSVALAGVGTSTASSYSASDLLSGGSVVEAAGVGVDLLELVFDLLSAFTD